MMKTKESHSPDVPVPADKPMGALVVESDAGIRWSLERGLSHSGYQVKVASTPSHAIEYAQNNGVTAVLMEIMPEAGFTVELLSRLLTIGGAPVVLCSSVDASPHIIMECVQRGASGFLPRPFSLGEVRTELYRALTARRDMIATLPGADNVPDREPSLIVGVSQAIQELRSIIRQVAQTDLNCLIRGESGVGKDVVAREIHRLSYRRSKPFVKVNCTALPEQLLESELFGFEKGAFTGATAPKPGRFTLADKGIIFLDEICDVPMSLQAKLLQVIEHKEFTMLGGVSTIRVDTQIVAATNASIEERIQERQFRHDLFFRLNEICIRVPPLSERKEDIPLLARHFIQKHGDHKHKGIKPDLSYREIEALCAWSWPGNIRELESTIKRWLTLGQLQIGPSSYQEHTSIIGQNEDGAPSEAETDPNDPSPDQIREVLESCQWNRRKACETLGISYQALRRRIIKYGLMQPGE